MEIGSPRRTTAIRTVASSRPICIHTFWTLRRAIAALTESADSAISLRRLRVGLTVGEQTVHERSSLRHDLSASTSAAETFNRSRNALSPYSFGSRVAGRRQEFWEKRHRRRCRPKLYLFASRQPDVAPTPEWLIKNYNCINALYGPFREHTTSSPFSIITALVRMLYEYEHCSKRANHSLVDSGILVPIRDNSSGNSNDKMSILVP